MSEKYTNHQLKNYYYSKVSMCNIINRQKKYERSEFNSVEKDCLFTIEKFL